MSAEGNTRQLHRAGIAAFVGTMIEWYDFYIYSTAAALVLGPLFFPSADRTAALAAAFATYAVGYFARPVGAIIFGHIGDRFGRQPALVITTLGMGTATLAVGLLPTHAQVGIWAPILLVLLRVVQGLAVGGEWGGAVLIAVEHAPEDKKTFYGGYPQLGNPAGALLASGIFAVLSLFGEDALQQWGWRVPFLLSTVLIGVGLYIRLRVEESPVFQQEKAEKAKRVVPLKHALRVDWPRILLGIGMVAVPTGGYYIITTYVTAYATGDSVGLSNSIVLDALTLGAFFELIATMPIAWLGDKLGRIKVFVGGLVAMGLLGIPLFTVVSSDSIPLIFLVFCIMRFASGGTYAPLAAIMAQSFDPEARYTSISLAYQVSGAVFGGLSPLVSTLLFGFTGTIWSVIFFLIAMCILSIACAVAAPQYSDPKELRQMALA
jgi:MFS family permease